MTHLQGQHVPRMGNGYILQNARGLMPAPIQQMADGGDMPRLLFGLRQLSGHSP